MPILAALIPAIATLGAVGQALLQVGIAVALALVSRALAPKDDQGRGVNTEVQLGGEVPRQCAFGRVASAGHLVYVNTYGSQNKLLQLVFVLSEGRCDALEKVWINGEEYALTSVAVTGTEHARYTIGAAAASGGSAKSYGSKITVRWFDGRSGQSADTDLTGNDNPNGRWTTNDKLTGLCYVSLTLEYDAEIFDQGIPDFLWQFRGLRLYDWRLDSTNGGTGTHRWNDPATWAWSQNPAVIRYNFQRGIFIAGQRVCGQAVAVYDLLHDLYTTAANICDQTVSLAAGGTETRYTAALIVSEGERYGDALDRIDAAMAGFGVERQGAFAPIAGAAYTVAVTISDADLVVGEPVEYSAKRSRADLVNAVFGQFTDPANLWEMNSYPALVSTTLETEDGGERLGLDLNLPAVTSVTQAQRIAKIRRNEARAQKTASIVLGFNWSWLEAGDWITWNSALYGNWTARIVGRSITADRRVRLELTEVSNTVYSWASAEETAVTLPPTPQAPGTRPTTVSGFGLQASTVTAGDAELPSIIFFWTPPTDPTIDAVVIEYRKVGDTPVTRISDASPEDGEHEVYPVLPGVNYEGRATIVTTPRRTTTFTSWVQITTDPNLIGTGVVPGAIDFDALTAQLRSEIARITDPLIQGAVPDLRAKVAQLQAKVALSLASHALQAHQDRVETKHAIVARYAESIAAIIHEETVRATEDEALANLITALTATVDNNTASIIAEQTVRANADSALASDILALDAAVDGNTAAIATEQTTRANADSALTTSVNTAQSTANSAASAAAAAQADADANTASIAAVELTVADHESAISQTFLDLVAFNGDGSADVSVRMTAAALPVGALAAVEWQVRAGFGGSWATAAIQLAAYSGSISRVKLKADFVDFEVGGQVLQAALRVEAAEPYNVSVVGGQITVPLGERRLIYKTVLTANAQMQYPSGAKPGMKWTHIIKQDATGGRQLTTVAAFSSASPVPLSSTAANAETICDGEILYGPGASQQAYLTVRGGGAAVGATGSQIYDTPGSYSFVVPAGAGTVTVKVWGGGGGGGGGGPSSTTGAAGGQSRFNEAGGNLIANGGGGGVEGDGTGLGGAGGTASGGTTNTTGTAGNAWNHATQPAKGGNAPAGGGTGGLVGGNPGGSPGAGGGGNSYPSTNNMGGGGGAGGYSTKSYSALVAGTSIGVVVGAGGNGGTGSRSGGLGGNGRVEISWVP